MTERLARTLGIEQPSGGDLRGALLRSLRFTTMMVVIDSCEHVVPHVAELVNAITTSSPGTRVLVTSRSSVGVQGERVVRIHPLPLPEPDLVHGGQGPALRLLIERAVAAGAELNRYDPALKEITRRLDGIPLALELAAPRLASMSPGELAARLDRRLDMGSAPHARHPRQHTMRATINFSYELLEPSERALLTALSVCPGDWSLDFAEWLSPLVGDHSQDGAAIMACLTDSSLINHRSTPWGTSRYSMLETVREFAGEQLARDKAATALGTVKK